jgi:Transposase zinc-binding domain
MQPDLEVAEIFRRHGAVYRELHADTLGRAQLRVMRAIELCRTAALGGHTQQCDACSHIRISYNSCLMGKFGNGESVGRFAGLGAVFQRSRSPLP